MEVLQRTANRGSISTGLYEIDNSLKFEADNAENLYYSNSVGENRRTWTYSTWIKKTELTTTNANGGTLFGAFQNSSNRMRILQYNNAITLHANISGTTDCNVRTNRLLRDTSAWYHIMVVLDTTQGTASNRVKIYVNGVQETSMEVSTYPSQNYSFAINNAVPHFVGQKGDDSDYFNGYMAETYFVDSAALAPTDFGEFDDDSGIWIPIEYDGAEYPSQDTNHWYLKFDNSSSLGADSSGNGKNMSLTNIAAIDQATDTPTNNFAVGNPLNVTPAGIFTQGATRWVSVNGTGMNGAWNLATIAMPAGKWHCEVKCIANDSYFQWGISPTHPNDNFSTRLMYRSDGNIYNAGAGGNTTGHASYTNGDIIGMSYDASANTVIFSKNGTAVVTKTAIANDEPYFFGGTGLSSGTYTGDFNFGGYANYAISSAATDANGYGTFEYAPPSGYLALCTKNLAETGG